MVEALTFHMTQQTIIVNEMWVCSHSNPSVIGFLSVMVNVKDRVFKPGGEEVACRRCLSLLHRQISSKGLNWCATSDRGCLAPRATVQSFSQTSLWSPITPASKLRHFPKPKPNIHLILKHSTFLEGAAVHMLCIMKIYSSQGWNVRLSHSKLWFALLRKTAIHGSRFKSWATAGTEIWRQCR